MFIYHGVYTQLDDADEAWTMGKYTIPTSGKIAEGFNPEHFGAIELGGNYITITTKHQDGFCPFEILEYHECKI